MGSKQKVKEFLESSETRTLYSSIVEFTLVYFASKAEKEGNQKFAEELKKTRKELDKDFSRAMEMVEEVYCEIFSDEELKELIVIHSTPASRKLRGLTSEIVNKTLEKYSLLPS